MGSPDDFQVFGRSLPAREPIDQKTVRRTFVFVAIIATLASALLAASLLRVNVIFAAPTPCGPACWDIVVTEVTASETLGSYTVTLNERGRGSPVSAPLAPGRILGVLTFTDFGVPNRLDAGDAFRLEDLQGPSGCDLYLTYLHLRTSGSVTWAC